MMMKKGKGAGMKKKAASAMYKKGGAKKTMYKKGGMKK
jgi:hypothetical protein|tara:strand:+ start:48785 stop:48898 length:114 start_codon:yes stop_codon:yes gene_type:complete